MKKYIYSKVSELLDLISKYVDFEKILKELISIEKDADFSYTNEWFKNLFYSKNEQEFLYRSANVLLSNENSQMIESIMHLYEGGFKGDVYEGCAIWGERLGAKYSKSPCIFCMCGHNFHNKWYNEEVKHSLISETKSSTGQITECPLWLKTKIYLENRQRRKINNRRRQARDDTSVKHKNEDLDYFSIAGNINSEGSECY